jgi:hypothetical protein
VPGPVKDDLFISRKGPVGPDSAALIERARGEIGGFESNGIRVGPRLAGDLAEDCIVTGQRGQDQCGPPLRFAEVGEREIQDYYIALYKLAQAASSSGVSQFLAGADSAASVGTTFSA